jgi:DNA-binding transcriptional MerR regulator
MGATDTFSTEDVQRILGLTAKQLDYWDRLRLVSPRKEQGSRFYDFRDLIGLRTVKQLVEEGVPANRLRRALAASFPMEKTSLWNAAVHALSRSRASLP